MEIQTKAEGEAGWPGGSMAGSFAPHGYLSLREKLRQNHFFSLQNKAEINVVADQTGSPTYALELSPPLKHWTESIFNGVKVYQTNSGYTTDGLATAIQKQLIPIARSIRWILPPIPPVPKDQNIPS